MITSETSPSPAVGGDLTVGARPGPACAPASGICNRLAIDSSGLVSRRKMRSPFWVLAAASPLTSVDPSYAHKLLRDLAAWSQSIGFAPHRDFAVVDGMFGDVNADASEAVFPFGLDGKPTYVPGPYDDVPLIRRRMRQLEKYLGDDDIRRLSAVKRFHCSTARSPAQVQFSQGSATRPDANPDFHHTYRNTPVPA
jgi:hypothetical protein